MPMMWVNRWAYNIIHSVIQFVEQTSFDFVLYQRGLTDMTKLYGNCSHRSYDCPSLTMKTSYGCQPLILYLYLSKKLSCCVSRYIFSVYVYMYMICILRIIEYGYIFTGYIIIYSIANSTSSIRLSDLWNTGQNQNQTAMYLIAISKPLDMCQLLWKCLQGLYEQGTFCYQLSAPSVQEVLTGGSGRAPLIVTEMMKGWFWRNQLLCIQAHCPLT